MSSLKPRQPYAKKACEFCRASKTRCFMVSINKEVNSSGSSSSEEDAHGSNSKEKLSAEVSRYQGNSHAGKCIRCQKRNLECIYTSVSKKRGPKTKNSKMLVENLVEQQ
ncbi:8185_t:CDS:1 [Acaulospora morrowiae]|uniref:8185_t:CDS:1 n=1 Tax=Acaulospora morrowiae TaxID=94023 RepID=A0A9N8Z0Q3_9GLOM|nr:8185_t:CDS:1 [Acaulospora morrowiae]